MNYKQLQTLYTEKTGKTAVGMKKNAILAELKELSNMETSAIEAAEAVEDVVERPEYVDCTVEVANLRKHIGGHNYQGSRGEVISVYWEHVSMLKEHKYIKEV